MSFFLIISQTLVAACPIKIGKPIIEYRGKYMLASQLRPYKSGDNAGGGLRPTPHIIYHQLLTASGVENTNPASVVEMCVDGRSYGNEARFVWQSCQPNAEVFLFFKNYFWCHRLYIDSSKLKFRFSK